MIWRDGLTYDKDPQSVEPHGLDWTPWLAELGSSVLIATSSWAVSAPDVTLSESSIVTGSKRTQVKVAGGKAGTVYRLTNHIVTSSGVTDERTILLNVKQR